MTQALVDAGFEVTGVDTFAELLELARARVPAAHFVHASIHGTEIHDYDAVVAVGEPLTYHPEDADADNLVTTFFQRAAEVLPPGGLLIFDVIGLGEPSLAGRTWSSGDDWAVLVETTENQTARTLVRNIEVFRRIGDAYRCSHEAIGSIYLTFRCYATSSLSTDLQPKHRHRMALRSSPLVVKLSSPRDWLRRVPDCANS